MHPRLIRLFNDYADSHRHPMNRLSHKIGIPLIVFHILAMLDWIKLAELPIAGGVILSVGHIGAALAIAWYLAMSPKLGAILSVFFAVCFPIAWYTPKPVVIAIAIVAWIIQLAGHYVWEKKSPAFLSNIVQTLIGPIFFVALLLGDWPLNRRRQGAEAAAS